MIGGIRKIARCDYIGARQGAGARPREERINKFLNIYKSRDALSV